MKMTVKMGNLVAPVARGCAAVAHEGIFRRLVSVAESTIYGSGCAGCASCA